MKDNYGDKIVVTVTENSSVRLEVNDGSDYTSASLSPNKARRLAAKLLLAAEKLESSL